MQSKRSFSSLIFFFILGMQCLSAYGQTAGCPDPQASNYNPAVTANDGSCTYNAASLKTQVKVDPLSATLAESSGLQMASNFLWSFNDGGGAAALYRIDTLTNAILQTVNIGGAINIDWEDIAFDGTCFYIGDFGNNASGDRRDLKIYKVPLSAIPDFGSNATFTVPAAQVEVINFAYKDQVSFDKAAPNSTKFDCEAMLVDGGKIHLFTKNWVDVNTTHYVIDATTAGTYTAMPVETLATGYLVTAADKAPGRDLVVLLGYQASGTGNHFMHLLYDYKNGAYFNGNKRKLSMSNAAEMGQVEGLTLRNSMYGYISNEYFERTVFGFTVSVSQKLRAFSLDEFFPAYVLPVKLKTFTAVRQHDGNNVQWLFAEPVQELQLQYSTNGIDFVTIQTMGAAAGGRYLHKPTAVKNCYRLTWKDASGSKQLSEVVCVTNPAKGTLSNMTLNRSGELFFTSLENAPHDFLFRLLSTDGKVVAQRQHQVVSPGTNKLAFAATLLQNAAMIVETIGNNERNSLLLYVQ